MRALMGLIKDKVDTLPPRQAGFEARNFLVAL
jgi:hypothetical protein